MKKLELTSVAPVWFTWEILFFHQWTEFWSVKIKAPLEQKISLYIFLFIIIRDLYKDTPEVQINKFVDLFELSLSVNWPEITEKQIMDLFGNKFTIKFKKLWIK